VGREDGIRIHKSKDDTGIEGVIDPYVDSLGTDRPEIEHQRQRYLSPPGFHKYLKRTRMYVPLARVIQIASGLHLEDLMTGGQIRWNDHLRGRTRTEGDGVPQPEMVGCLRDQEASEPRCRTIAYKYEHRQSPDAL